jgi:hypothetical protein
MKKEGGKNIKKKKKRLKKKNQTIKQRQENGEEWENKTKKKLKN